jgi:hypothetical protein
MSQERIPLPLSDAFDFLCKVAKRLASPNYGDDVKRFGVKEAMMVTSEDLLTCADWGSNVTADTSQM